MNSTVRVALELIDRARLNLDMCQSRPPEYRSEIEMHYLTNDLYQAILAAACAVTQVRKEINWISDAPRTW